MKLIAVLGMVLASAQAANWVGDTARFVGNSNFCGACGNFGAPSCDFVCAGGGSSGGGSGCGTASPNPCTSGQYDFSAADGWTIELQKTTAVGAVPYRAFAYCPFCHGSPMSSCWDGSAHDLRFSFKLGGFEGWGTYVKLLFWTDSFNLLGLLPKGAKGAQQAGINDAVSLIAMPTTDFPNAWAGIMPLQDGTWYDVVVTVTRNGAGVMVNKISVNGKVLATNQQNPTGLSGDSNGAQLGMYSFDFGGIWGSTTKADLSLKTLSFGPSGPGPKPAPSPTPGAVKPSAPPQPKPTAPVPKPTSPEPKPTSPVPKPTSPVPKPTSPAPKPTPSTSEVCYCSCGCATCYKICDCKADGAKKGSPFESEIAYGTGDCFCQCPSCRDGSCYARCPCDSVGSSPNTPWVK